MANKTRIEWADLTINPIIGCTKCSPGCNNCYAEKMALRLAGHSGLVGERYQDVVNGLGFEPLLRGWNGKTHIDSSCFDHLPQKPSRIFVGSMGDVFHEPVPQSAITVLCNRMTTYPQHTFMLLTKRVGRMRNMMIEAGKSELFRHAFPLPNVWLGVTVCDQNEADEKIPILLSTPAAKRFVSVEPMLGKIELRHFLGHVHEDERGLDWIICGGETGPGARPMHPNWARSLRDQCQAVGVPFFFKGWGAWVTENQAPDDIVLPGIRRTPKGWRGKKYEDSVFRAGKKAAGCFLDGHNWHEQPPRHGHDA